MKKGAIDPEQFRMDSLFDRMDCIGKSVLGLTIQCAQCHTHKYDPMTQEEYYRLFAFINNDEELTTAVYGPDDRRTIQSIHDDLSADRARVARGRIRTGRQRLRRLGSHGGCAG
jgi:hypothetical protein